MEPSEGVHRDQQGSDNSLRWSGKWTDEAFHNIRGEDQFVLSLALKALNVKVLWSLSSNKRFKKKNTKNLSLRKHCMEVSIHCNLLIREKLVCMEDYHPRMMMLMWKCTETGRNSGWFQTVTHACSVLSIVHVLWPTYNTGMWAARLCSVDDNSSRTRWRFKAGDNTEPHHKPFTRPSKL